MNKLLGFYELRDLNIPTVKWHEFDENTFLSSDKLWTIRCAVLKGDDFNLPRAVGVTAMEGIDFGNEFKQQLGKDGIVIYYPYFNAVKSGTLQISRDVTVIEAVYEDLWNLVTHSKLDVSIQISDKENRIYGNGTFFTEEEINLLRNAEMKIREKKSRGLRDGLTFLLEWSFAQEVNIERQPINEPYLVFYECRTI